MDILPWMIYFYLTEFFSFQNVTTNQGWFDPIRTPSPHRMSATGLCWDKSVVRTAKISHPFPNGTARCHCKYKLDCNEGVTLVPLFRSRLVRSFLKECSHCPVAPSSLIVLEIFWYFIKYNAILTFIMFRNWNFYYCICQFLFYFFFLWLVSNVKFTKLMILFWQMLLYILKFHVIFIHNFSINLYT